ncbi:MAG: thermonuclease family protein [Halothece sp.]
MKINSSFVILVGFALIVWGVAHRAELNSPVAGNQCRVKPGSIYDGDTLRVLCRGEELKIRLCGIDAPEKAQAGGMASRDYLRSRLPDNAIVRVNPIETDRYGRKVAEVFLGETFINAEMVRKGYAWHYPGYSRNCPNRSAIAQAAQETELTGTPPWEFRKGN